MQKNQGQISRTKGDLEIWQRQSQNPFSSAFWVQKDFVLNQILGPKTFWVQKILGPKKFRVQKKFESKRYLDPKKFWVQ